MDLNKMIKLVDTLRGEKGCPWDRKQTPETMAVYLLEEVYELVDAIQTGDPDQVCGELGDVLFLLVFVAKLYQETGHFHLRDAVGASVEKMTRRHPHVFGKGPLSSAEEVRQQWHRIKDEEKRAEGASVLDSVPLELPGLMRAYRIAERAAAKGFDWDTTADVLEKAEEEWSEFRSELSEMGESTDVRNRASVEFGDILFTLVNVARFAGIHPEMALKLAVKKFEKRFRYMEQLLSERGRDLDSTSTNDLRILWQTAKGETQQD